MLLMIDSYDSFTYNLVQYQQTLGAEVKVIRNDELSVAQIEALAPERIVISPGPCTPNEAGVSVDVIRQFGPRVPILGVCLGHQSLGQACGGDVVRAKTIMHGKTSRIRHDGRGVTRCRTASRSPRGPITRTAASMRSWVASPRASGRGRAVPSRVDPDRAWACTAEEFPGTMIDP